jgi:NAD(P)-dependent dehydrogenase (short-subunit alcohol dehydrogenase family)
MTGRTSLKWWLAAGAAFLGVRALVRRVRYFKLENRRVLITGGSRGLGLIIARRMVREHARVAICARDRDELERARRELVAAGGDVLTVACDITDRAQVEQMVGIVQSRFGGVDVLINNAGVIEVGPMEMMDIAEYEEAMCTHFWGPLYTTLAVLPAMKKQGGGRIVNIASIGGKVSVPHLLPYSASKFALVGLSEGLRAELAKDGIVVTTVCPGLMRTGSQGHAIVKGNHQAEIDWFTLIGTLPLTSMSADRAAARIMLAIERGEAEVTISAPARALDKLHALFPGATADLLGLINRILPEPDEAGAARVTGDDLPISHPVLSALGTRAAAANNEMNMHARIMAGFRNRDGGGNHSGESGDEGSGNEE